MDGEIINPNGSAPPTPAPIVIILRLHPTPQGYALQIEHDPSVFADQVIDACTRAARHYERVALLNEIAAKDQRAVQLQREIGNLRHRLS